MRKREPVIRFPLFTSFVLDLPVGLTPIPVQRRRRYAFGLKPPIIVWRYFL
jgi:hypothetical protein